MCSVTTKTHDNPELELRGKGGESEERGVQDEGQRTLLEA